MATTFEFAELPPRIKAEEDLSLPIMLRCLANSTYLHPQDPLSAKLAVLRKEGDDSIRESVENDLSDPHVTALDYVDNCVVVLAFYCPKARATGGFRATAPSGSLRLIAEVFACRLKREEPQALTWGNPVPIAECISPAITIMSEDDGISHFVTSRAGSTIELGKVDMIRKLSAQHTDRLEEVEEMWKRIRHRIHPDYEPCLAANVSGQLQRNSPHSMVSLGGRTLESTPSDIQDFWSPYTCINCDCSCKSPGEYLMDAVPRGIDTFWGIFDNVAAPTDPKFETIMHEYSCVPKFGELEHTYSWEL